MHYPTNFNQDYTYLKLSSQLSVLLEWDKNALYLAKPSPENVKKRTALNVPCINNCKTQSMFQQNSNCMNVLRDTFFNHLKLRPLGEGEELTGFEIYAQVKPWTPLMGAKFKTCWLHSLTADNQVALPRPIGSADQHIRWGNENLEEDIDTLPARFKFHRVELQKLSTLVKFRSKTATWLHCTARVFYRIHFMI